MTIKLDWVKKYKDTDKGLVIWLEKGLFKVQQIIERKM